MKCPNCGSNIQEVEIEYTYTVMAFIDESSKNAVVDRNDVPGMEEMIIGIRCSICLNELDLAVKEVD